MAGAASWRPRRGAALGAALLLSGAAAAARGARVQEAAAACGSIGVDPATLMLVDACQRQRIHRGYNAVFKGPPWHPDTVTYSPQLSLCATDWAVLQSLGTTAIRLGVMWPGVQPTGPYTANGTYLQVMTNLTAAMGQFGIYSLLDFHQDAVSGVFCGEGVPNWAATAYAAAARAQPFPLPLQAEPYPINASTGEPTQAACNNNSWSNYYFADAAGKVMQQIYTNTTGALADFQRFWSLVTEAYTDPAASPWVLGSEIMNEPWVRARGWRILCHAAAWGGVSSPSALD
jgi:endoglycosylceramidase